MDFSENPLETPQDLVKANVDALLAWSHEVVDQINWQNDTLVDISKALVELAGRVETLTHRYAALEDVVTEKEMSKMDWDKLTEGNSDEVGD